MGTRKFSVIIGALRTLKRDSMQKFKGLNAKSGLCEFQKTVFFKVIANTEKIYYQ